MELRLGSADRERCWTLDQFELFEHAPDAVLVIDATGAIVFANHQTERVFDYVRGELLGQSIEVLVPLQLRECHRDERARYQTAPRARPMGAGLDLSGVRKDGREIPLDISLSPIPTDRGIFIIAAIRDISERKHAERKLLETNRQLRRDMELAARLQKSLLPSVLPRMRGLSVAWAFEPCERLAGDSFNVFALDDCRIAFYVLDVAGHGVAAALQSVALTRFLAAVSWPSSMLHDLVSPAAVAQELNRQFPIDTDSWQYFTFLCGVLDAYSAELRFASAGHPGPIHVPLTAAPVAMDLPGFPIGLFPDVTYDERRVALSPGDRFYLYSDGVIDAMNAAQLPFGRERLLRQLDTHRSQPLGGSVASVVTAVMEWSQECGPTDDISLVAVEALAR